MEVAEPLKLPCLLGGAVHFMGGDVDGFEPTGDYVGVGPALVFGIGATNLTRSVDLPLRSLSRTVGRTGSFRNVGSFGQAGPCACGGKQSGSYAPLSYAI